MPEKKPSFFEAEKDLVRRSSGRNKEEDGVAAAMEDLKMALMAAAAVEVLREEEQEEEAPFVEGSRTARRSQRQEGQKPVKFSSGWRSQYVEGRWGCGGWS